MARFFADECVAAEIVEELRAAGLDVAYAKDICPGSPDPHVLKLAAEDGRILVTHDLGFGELAVRQGQPAAGSLSCLCTRFLSAHASVTLRRGYASWATVRSAILR